MIKFPKAAITAIPVTAAVFLVGFVFNWLKITTTTLYSAIPSTNLLTGTIGGKAIGSLTGILGWANLSLMAVVEVYISAVIILMLGGFLVDKLRLPTAKGAYLKLASIIVWGAVPVYLLLVGLVVPQNFMSVAIGVIINTVAVAFVASWIAGVLKMSLN